MLSFWINLGERDPDAKDGSSNISAYVEGLSRRFKIDPSVSCSSANGTGRAFVEVDNVPPEMETTLQEIIAVLPWVESEPLTKNKI